MIQQHTDEYKHLAGEFQKEMTARRLRDDTAGEISPLVVAGVVVVLVVSIAILTSHPFIMEWATINTK